MDIEFKLPELGENITSASLVNILVSEGDKVAKDQALFEIETDKATIEVPSTNSGTIKKILAKAGNKVDVGSTIMIIASQDGGESMPSSTKGAITMEKEEPTIEDNPVNDMMPEQETKVEARDEEQPSGETSTVDIIMPELGENITNASIVSVLVKVGDKVSKDQSILEIETDKATIEVPSTVSGTIKSVNIKAGDKGTVGEVLMSVETSGGGQRTAIAPKAEQVQSKVDTSENKKEVSTKESSEEKFKPEEQKDTSKGQKEKVEPGEVDEQPPIQKGAAPAAPSVRRIAREIGVDINQVSGTGPRGRITMDDVKLFSKTLHEKFQTAKGGSEGGTGFTGVKKEQLPDFSKFGNIERKPMNNIRSKTANHLTYAWNVIPHVTQFDKADITHLEEIRKKYNPSIEKAGGKLTITAILVKVLEYAIKKFPQFNSSVDMDNQEVIYKNYYNIGIAVDTEFGLIVPNIKNVDKKSLTDISIEMNTIAEKARNKKIGLDDLQGGCITITNLGGIGGTSFTPIVNSPEVAILGVSRGSMEQVYINGNFVPRLMLPLSLSYDHRIVDGADAARFIRYVCEVLEDPFKLLL